MNKEETLKAIGMRDFLIDMLKAGAWLFIACNIMNCAFNLWISK
jgi:hypothetical protein